MTRVARTLGLLGLVMGVPLMISLARGSEVRAAGQAAQADRIERTDQTDQADREKPAGQASAAAQAGKADRADKAGKAGKAAPAKDEPALERSTADADEARREALWRHVSHDGARVHIGGSVFVGENERVGKVFALFGNAEVNGIVDHEVVAVGGDVVLGPKAMVRGDVMSVGGTVRTAQGAFIGGQTGQINVSPNNFKIVLPDDGQMTVAFRPDWPRIAGIAFVTGAMRYLFWFVACALLIAAAPRAVGRSRERAGTSPISAFAVGLLAELLIVPIVGFLAVVLSISVVGIPLLALLPILMLAFGLAMAIGFTGVASGLGSRLVGRATPVGALVFGLALIWGVGMSGHWLWTMSRGAFGWGVVLMAAGFFIEYLACTLGLGATLLSWSANRRRRQAPAPSPEPFHSVDPDPVPQQL